MQMTIGKGYRWILASLLGGVLSFGSVARAVDIVPPDSLYDGKSYAQWLEHWWQWTASIPGDASDSPFNDVTGAHANLNQTESVFFLSKSWQYQELPLIDGNRPPAEERSAVVPAGSAIFVPFDGIIRLDAFDPSTVAQENFDFMLNAWSPFVAELVVDGQELPIDTTLSADQHSPYLIPSPVFSIDVPEGSSFLPAFGLETTDARSIQAQAWEFMALLEPLPVGSHTINVFGADSIGTEFEWQTRVNWNIEVAVPGDTNFDGVVEMSDFLTLSRNFGQAGDWSAGDFDGSGEVGFPDFLQLSNNFGTSPAKVAAVPEPNSLSLFTFALLGIIGLHRRA